MSFLEITVLDSQSYPGEKQNLNNSFKAEKSLRIKTRSLEEEIFRSRRMQVHYHELFSCLSNFCLSEYQKFESFYTDCKDVIDL